mmetsp:Transcript_4365/g.9163  ORF Transcript_4365/g.9163 Transcript_4365/m.9163 type:complete len:215 (+) Transcript_4365:891-1535(+)
MLPPQVLVVVLLGEEVRFALLLDLFRHLHVALDARLDRRPLGVHGVLSLHLLLLHLHNADLLLRLHLLQPRLDGRLLLVQNTLGVQPVLLLLPKPLLLAVARLDLVSPRLRLPLAPDLLLVLEHLAGLLGPLLLLGILHGLLLQVLQPPLLRRELAALLFLALTLLLLRLLDLHPFVALGLNLLHFELELEHLLELLLLPPFHLMHALLLHLEQ